MRLKGQFTNRQTELLSIINEFTADKDFAVLTAEISKATFDMNLSEYLELIFNMLGEASTKEAKLSPQTLL